jgi:hypothetical protein
MKTMTMMTTEEVCLGLCSTENALLRSSAFHHHLSRNIVEAGYLNATTAG